MTRPDWKTYYLGIAEAVSKRGECSRRRVGAILVKDQTIVSTGYNGHPSGARSCLDGGCPRANMDATPGTGYAETGCTVVHAETNALLRAGMDRAKGATMYVTEQPCDLCWSLVRAAGVFKVVVKREGESSG